MWNQWWLCGARYGLSYAQLCIFWMQHERTKKRHHDNNTTSEEEQTHKYIRFHKVPKAISMRHMPLQCMVHWEMNIIFYLETNEVRLNICNCASHTNCMKYKTFFKTHDATSGARKRARAKKRARARKKTRAREKERARSGWNVECNWQSLCRIDKICSNMVCVCAHYKQSVRKAQIYRVHALFSLNVSLNLLLNYDKNYKHKRIIRIVL